MVESVHGRATNDIAAVVSTSRLHNIAGKYTGKDDPVALVRVQGNFPATGEVLGPYRLAHYVAGTMRGSHNGPLMPVKLNSPVSFFDGPPIVSCAGFCVHNGKFTEPVDLFNHPFWDWVRNNASQKAAKNPDAGILGARDAAVLRARVRRGGRTRCSNSTNGSLCAPRSLEKRINPKPPDRRAPRGVQVRGVKNRTRAAPHCGT